MGLRFYARCLSRNRFIRSAFPSQSAAGLMFDSAQTPADRWFTFRRMLPKLDTPQVFELNLGDYNTNGASIGSGGNDTTFAFTIWPLPDATVAALDDLAQKHGTIRLYCCRQPLLFDLVAVERKEPLKARIEGRIVGGVSYAKRNAQVR